MIRRRPVPDFVFETAWKRFADRPTNERVIETGRLVLEQIEAQYHIELRKEERAALRKALQGMVRRQTLKRAYSGLYDWLDRPDLLKTGPVLEYADVFPLIYLRMKLEGLENPYAGVKHLLVDEMQDYTPVQYAVLGRLFPCRKTILGDASQSVNPYSASRAEDIEAALSGAWRVTLNKSYRSTWEIMQFALAIRPNPDLIAMKRHGEEPQLHSCRSVAEALERVMTEVSAFMASDHSSLRYWQRHRNRRLGFMRR